MAGRIIHVVGDGRGWPVLRVDLRQAVEDLQTAVQPLPQALYGPVAGAIDISDAGLGELEDSSTRDDLKALLAESDFRLVGAAVDAPDLPGWDRPQRAARAVALAELLADLNPQRTELVLESSLGLPPDAGEDRERRAAAYMLRVAAFCHDLRVQTRRVVRICLSAEPGGLADTTADVAGFLRHRLSGEDAVRQLAGLAAITREEAATALADHFGLCCSGDGWTGEPDSRLIRLQRAAFGEFAARLRVTAADGRGGPAAPDIWVADIRRAQRPAPDDRPPAGAMALEVPRRS